ncbi:MAG: DUF1906 domain-containing protein [Hyphomonadaceae bacterium]
MGLSRRNFLFASGAAIAAASCGSSPQPASSAPSTPATPTPTPAGSGFPLIADTAARIDVTKAKALRNHGVKTVFRYYCHLPPSLPGKDLQPEEARIILGEGLSIGSVFQHYNNCFRTFENKWGKEDAEQALRMAHAAGQPEGSAIYFGVDADWPYSVLRDPIIQYFEDVKRAFEGSGIAVGIYSNGCICNAVREKGLAQHFWLSGSTGHSGTQAFYNTGRWTLFQNALDVTPEPIGFGVDANLANPTSQGYFGQWTDKGASVASHGAVATQSVFVARSFLRANTELKSVADTASTTLLTIRKDLNVRRLAAVNDWVQVQTQEGGARGAAAPLVGWLPASALAPMDRFPDNSSNYGLCGAPTTVSDTAKYQNCERAASRLR